MRVSSEKVLKCTVLGEPLILNRQTKIQELRPLKVLKSCFWRSEEGFIWYIGLSYVLPRFGPHIWTFCSRGENQKFVTRGNFQGVCGKVAPMGVASPIRNWPHTRGHSRISGAKTTCPCLLSEVDSNVHDVRCITDMLLSGVDSNAFMVYYRHAAIKGR